MVRAVFGKRRGKRILDFERRSWKKMSGENGSNFLKKILSPK